MAPKIKHNVTGNLVGDPEMLDLESGKRLLTFRLAETPRWYDREAQEWKAGQTTYYDVAMNESAQARNALATLKFGMRVDVVGDYNAKPYVNKEGQASLNHRIFADKVSPSLEFATAVVTKNQPRQQHTQDHTQEATQTQHEQQAVVDEAWGLHH